MITKESMMDTDECSSCMITKVEVADDLILEILFLLPPVSVIRFKYVCKSWYSLISNPDLLFLKHYHHHPQRLLDYHSDDILLISTVKEDKQQQHNHVVHEFVHLPPQTQNQNQNQKQLKQFLDHALSVFIPQKFSSSSSYSPPRLIDSCNGLLLYRTKNNPISCICEEETIKHHVFNPDTGDETTEFHVFNPVTKQCFKLPMIDSLGKGSICWLHIVFDPSISLSFKVLLCFSRNHQRDDSGIYLYSSSESETSSSSWKYLTKFSPLYNRFHCQFRAVLLDGFLYLYKCSKWLLCFDVVKDKIWFLPFPQRGREGEAFRRSFLLYFGKCGGSLRMVQRFRSYRDQGHQPLGCYIIELEVEVGPDQPKIRNWTVKFDEYDEYDRYDYYDRYDQDDRVIINYENHIPSYAQFIHIYKTSAGKQKGEDGDEALLFFEVSQKAIISYNLTSKTYGEEQVISDFDYSHCLHVISYTSHFLHAFSYTPFLFPFSC